MDFNIEIRRKQLQSLEHYISSSKDKVQSILDCLGWSVKEVTREELFIKCSVDPSHRVPVKSVDEHVKKCLLRKQSYNLNDNFLSEPVHDTNASIAIDDTKKVEILSVAHKSNNYFKTAWNGQDPDPQTSDRLLSTFSADERLALYDYVVENTTGPKQSPEFNVALSRKSVVDKSLSHEEQLVLERDAKRRRIKYKSVHTNRKNHTEVLREVINGQMEEFKDWLVDNGVSDQSDHSHNREEQSKVTNYEPSKLENSRDTPENTACDRSRSVNSRHSAHSESSRSTHRRSDYDYYVKKRDKYSKDRYDGHESYRHGHKNDYRNKKDRDYYKYHERLVNHSSSKYKRSRSRSKHRSGSNYSVDDRHKRSPS